MTQCTTYGCDGKVAESCSFLGVLLNSIRKGILLFSEHLSASLSLQLRWLDFGECEPRLVWAMDVICSKQVFAVMPQACFQLQNQKRMTGSSSVSSTAQCSGSSSVSSTAQCSGCDIVGSGQVTVEHTAAPVRSFGLDSTVAPWLQPIQNTLRGVEEGVAVGPLQQLLLLCVCQN